MKRKSNWSVIFMILISFTCFACDSNENNQNKSVERSEGNYLKSITETIYQPVYVKDKLVTGEIIEVLNSYYDENGVKTHENRLDYKGIKEFEAFYFYDDSDFLVEIKEYFNCPLAGMVGKVDIKLVHNIRYEYNENGNIVAEIINDVIDEFIQKIEYKYDENSNLIEEKFISDFDTFTDLYKYDENGNRSERKHFNYSGYIYYTYTYEYENSNMVKENTYRADGLNVFTRFFEYDELGNLVKEQLYTQEHLIETIFYEYVFNSSGEKIEKSKYFVFFENDEREPVTITTWEYNY